MLDTPKVIEFVCFCALRCYGSARDRHQISLTPKQPPGRIEVRYKNIHTTVVAAANDDASRESPLQIH